MAGSKFDALKSAKAQEVKEESHLKETKAKAQKKNQMIYGIPVDLSEAIEASGQTLSGFAKRAMIKVAREEGIF